MGKPNRNLLDNPWFTVNQRGASTYTAASSYTVDRWATASQTGNGVSVTSDGITMKSTSSKACSLVQRFPAELTDQLWGKTVTLSVMLKDGTLYSQTATLPATCPSPLPSSTTVYINIRIGNSWWFNLQLSTTGVMNVLFWVDNGSAKTIYFRAVKLELGSTSTLAYETAPNYAKELAKCQFYYERKKASTSADMNLGLVIGTTSQRYWKIVMRPKRALVTVTKSGTVVEQAANGSTTNVTDIYPTTTSQSINSGHMHDALKYEYKSAATPYIAILKSGAYIDFSAEL